MENNIKICFAESLTDLEQIITLQEKNHKLNIPAEKYGSEG
jgi:hypothetical protein